MYNQNTYIRLTDHSLSYDTVYGFTQVLYHGEVNLDEENFRDINFLATVLQVSGMFGLSDMSSNPRTPLFVTFLTPLITGRVDKRSL